MWSTGDIYPVRFTLSNVIIILTVCDFPRHHFLSSVGFLRRVMNLIFPSFELHTSEILRSLLSWCISSWRLRCHSCMRWLWLFFIFADFERRGCNTQRNQEVAALILFPQAPDPTTGGAYSISNITLHLLFIKMQEKKEREKKEFTRIYW